MEALEALQKFDFGGEPTYFGLRQQTLEAQQQWMQPAEAKSTGKEDAPANKETKEELEKKEREQEEKQVEKDKAELEKLMNVFSQGVPLNTNMEQIFENVSSDRMKNTDIFSIVLDQLNLIEMMNISNDFTPIDRTHPKVKTNFQNLMLSCENSRAKMKECFFDSINMPLRKAFKDNKQMLTDEFDYRECLDQINEEYLNKFKDIFIRDYTSQPDALPGQSQSFSTVYFMTLKMYLGRIVYELSRHIDGGVPGVKVLFKKAFVDYLNNFTGGVDITPFFEQVWPKINEGYLINKSLNAVREKEDKELQEIKELKELDDTVPEQGALSEMYMRGRLG